MKVFEVSTTLAIAEEISLLRKTIAAGRPATAGTGWG
jgi:hypothetical protein